MTTLHDAVSSKTNERKSAGEPSQPSNRAQSESDHLIRFSRDFSEAASGSSGPSSLVPESLSSASSFQSLASTLSSKSSSGICADSAPGSPDKVNSGTGFDHSYVNVDIPDLDDLISACAGINLNTPPLGVEEKTGEESADDSSAADLSQDQTFASAADDTISDETQVLVNESLQTFNTCPAIVVSKIQSTTITSSEVDVFKAPLPVKDQSSVIPYVSFEESVLRKHQEPVDDGTEFKSALNTFQVTQSGTVASTVDIRRHSYSPTPCEEIDVAKVAKFRCKSPQELGISEKSLVSAENVLIDAKEQHVQQFCVLDSPDASFQEVEAFDSTIVLNQIPTIKEPKVANNLNVSKSPNKNEIISQEKNKEVFSLDDVPLSVKSKESEVVQEATLATPNKTQDIVHCTNVINKIKDIQDTNILNKTQDIQDTNVLNKTQDIVQETNILNKTQDIVQETNILNKTQDIVQETNILNKTQDIVQETNILNKTQDIVQETNILNKTQDIVEEQNILNKTQDIIHEGADLNNAEVIREETNNSVISNRVIEQQISSINKTEIVQTETKIVNQIDIDIEKKEILKENLGSYNDIDDKPCKPLIQDARSPKYSEITEEPQNPNLLDDQVIASTPLPAKNLKKEKTSKTPKTKSALFTNEPKSPEFKSPQGFAQKSKSPIKSEEIKEEKNKLNFDQTLAVNKSFEKSSFTASELISKENLETIDKDLIEESFILPSQEPDYEAFKPVQQSTTLPFPDFQKLQEAALSVAQDIDDSIEKIEENEQFVSATTELFGDPTALDFLTKVGSQSTKRGARYDSLYMKFDPLAQRLSMLPQKNLPTSPSVDEEKEKEKETKVDTPSSDMGTPKKNPALAAIDRLLFYSPCPPNAAESATAEVKQNKEEAEKQEPQSVPVVDEKMAKELELVRSTVLQLESELEKQKLEHKEHLEKQKATYEEKIVHMQTKFSQMQSQLTQEVKSKGQMTMVVDEYEKSISRLIAESEKDRTNFEKEKAKLQEELQVANQHLSNTEAAFSDVHSKYERLKNVVSAYKSNETVLKESIAENQETIKTLENRYEQLKNHAMAQLEKANLELSAIRKQNEAETIKLKALVRKAELKSKSLAETVEQKVKENKELTQIIDEMIARVD